jgi:hypothetical protein
MKGQNKMNRTWLIQRLNKPYETENNMTKLANAFSFGGGLVNGGLSKEAMTLLSPLFNFDYMGSAEFEFGSVPETLSKIVKNRKDYIDFSMPIKFKYKEWKTKETKTGVHDVFIICDKKDKDEIVERISKFAKDDCYGDTKETVNLNSALANSEYRERLIGWLELDNGYMFFKDKKIGKKTADLLLRS